MNSPQASLRDIFTLVYRENRWGNEESSSGAGSALSSPAVLASVRALDELVRHVGIRSIIDVPCGDFYWIPLILGRFPHLEYIGLDIVNDLIERNRSLYPRYNFQVLDITHETPPRADLIFCKDLFLHLHHVDIARCLRNFKRSGSRFMLVTHMYNSPNEELVLDLPGACRHVDLTRPPYNLPKPMWGMEYLSLWALDALPSSVFDDLCESLEQPTKSAQQLPAYDDTAGNYQD